MLPLLNMGSRSVTALVVVEFALPHPGWPSWHWHWEGEGGGPAADAGTTDSGRGQSSLVGEWWHGSAETLGRGRRRSCCDIKRSGPLLLLTYKAINRSERPRATGQVRRGELRNQAAVRAAVHVAFDEHQ